ncbi:Type 4 pilin PilA [Desulfurella amilsii]|uniref:Type 4 pilin PilA n=1 Tax=Desulfurella amilsii TaxID=1562698 RepID=A0A1X4XW76_9BACT|nr:prepilin-type N-terminal cleavage/methylation domain-containing protein [Desulfurella amilsii]OSS41774.1 Type 4 pilin PilA [Desulfurella amilsii]
MLNLKHDVAQKGTLQKQAGFTLIELLIVIAIIAILAAIAIPQFLKYKQGAYLDSVRSDVKNVVTALESYDATNGMYPGQSASGTGSVAVQQMTGPGAFDANGTLVTTGTNGIFNISTGNIITVTADTTCTNGYVVSGYNLNITNTSIGGKDKAVSYNSCTGQYTGF